MIFSLWFANLPGVARRQVTFFCVAKRKSPKKRRPDSLGPFASLRATCGARSKRGLTRTRLRLKQSRALIRFDLRSSAQPDGLEEQTRMRMRGDDDALCASSPEYGTVIFARGTSTRGQMKSPFIAQRGEGGVRGGSGELAPTAQGEPEAQRDAEAQSMSSTVSGSGTSPIALRVRAL